MKWNTLIKGNIAVLSIAIPMVLSNITVPLLGLVDSAVIGHLEHAGYLGGVAIGGTMMNIILWLFGFLRMSTTGITAQAFGANNKKKQAQILLQGIFISLIFSVIILIFSGPLFHIFLRFSNASNLIKTYSQQYFLIRIISCPAALINLVFMGWLLGNQQAKKTMWLLISINLINIILDLIFVPGLQMGVRGAAIASATADYFGFVLGLYFVSSRWMANKLPNIKLNILTNLSGLLRLNLDIFIRSLFLQLVFGFMTFKGASFGDNIAAANSILINFLLFVSYVMDGFAYSMEALVGSHLGAKNKDKLYNYLIIATLWGLGVSLICTFIFAMFGETIINFMSSIDEVRLESKVYLPWLIAFPLISMWSFLLDGIFVGATLGRQMRNGMIVASLIYFISYALLHDYANHALWASMLIFMTTRWIVLGYSLKNTDIFNQNITNIA